MQSLRTFDQNLKNKTERLMSKNKHGLSRHIPTAIKMEVRQRSKFGCVLCRAGFYEYEHIDPPFENATQHDPASICCLCSYCHSMVTRGQRSKASVASAYEDIQAKTLEEAGRPFGPLDFDGVNAELRIGGLRYSPLVQTVLRYHGVDIIKVMPGNASVPGAISALFTNQFGEPVLELNENVWEGSTENWDIEIVSNRITVRSRVGIVSLRLRLEPPGIIVIEHLDMRFRDSHLLVSENAYAAGRYLSDGTIAWAFAQIRISRTASTAAAIEFTSQAELLARHKATSSQGQQMATADGKIELSSGAGCMWIPAGISIASLCGGFNLYGYSLGIRPIDGVRRMVSLGPDALMRYIGTGKETLKT